VVDSSAKSPVLFVLLQAFQSAKCPRGLLIASRGRFSDNGWVSIASQAGEGQSIVAPCGQFTGITVVYQATEDEPNGFSVESGPRYLDSMPVCGAAQWIKLCDS